MIINMTDPHMGIFAGITIFDEDGEPMTRVQELDTETLSCTISPFGKKAQAAGFVIEPNAALRNYLPDGLIPFVYPEKNPTKEAIQRFIQFFLTHRRMFLDTTAKYLEDLKVYQNSPAGKVRETWKNRYKGTYSDGVEDTFGWPREPFVALAKEVVPSEEEDQEAAEYAEKQRWGKGVVVYEKDFRIKGSATLPWKEHVVLYPFALLTMWLRTDDEGNLANWGFAVEPPAEFTVPNTVILVAEVDAGTPGERGTVPTKLMTQLLKKKWKVYATRGKDNGTIELLLNELKESPVEDLPSFVPEAEEGNK